MLLHPVSIPADRFTWCASERAFAAEISDLGPGFTFGRVWDDSADEGLTLVSRYPGKADIVFTVSHTEVRDGDLLYWNLTSADPNVPVSFTLTIFND